MPSIPDRGRYLLDTHVWVWLVDGAADIRSRDVLSKAAQRGALLVSAMSCWEVAMLVARGRLQFTMGLDDWIAAALKAPGISLLDIGVHALVESTRLPGEVQGDPIDRMLIAQCRSDGLALATRDRKILDYGEAGHVQILSC